MFPTKDLPIRRMATPISFIIFETGTNLIHSHFFPEIVWVVSETSGYENGIKKLTKFKLVLINKIKKCVLS